MLVNPPCYLPLTFLRFWKSSRIGSLQSSAMPFPSRMAQRASPRMAKLRAVPSASGWYWAPVRSDAHGPGRFLRVNVGAEKKKFPVPLFCAADHVPHVPQAIADAGVFHAVGGDDEEGSSRHIIRPGMAAGRLYMMERAAYRVCLPMEESSRMMVKGIALLSLIHIAHEETAFMQGDGAHR